MLGSIMHLYLIMVPFRISLMVYYKERVASTTPAIPNNWLYFGGKTDGSNGNNQHQVNGSYRSIRISSSARYSTNFTPDQILNIDNDTMHLYSLDEGDGDVVYDSHEGSNSDFLFMICRNKYFSSFRT